MPDHQAETLAALHYDSTADTLLHIRRVQQLLTDCARELLDRGEDHDQSKLFDPEKEAFDRLGPMGRTKYRSQAYQAALAQLGQALEHHYAVNRHHPEGVAGMDLLDLLEMLMDWKASAEKRDPGAIFQLTAAFPRFQIDGQLARVLCNTATNRGWSYQ